MLLPRETFFGKFLPPPFDDISRCKRFSLVENGSVISSACTYNANGGFYDYDGIRRWFN